MDPKALMEKLGARKRTSLPTGMASAIREQIRATMIEGAERGFLFEPGDLGEELVRQLRELFGLDGDGNQGPTLLI
jgi:hypothetical protein